MPKLADVFGVQLCINWKDNAHHNKPHVRAYYAEFEASIALDGELLAGSLPDKQLKRVRKFLTIFDDEVLDAWNKSLEGIPFEEVTI